MTEAKERKFEMEVEFFGNEEEEAEEEEEVQNPEPDNLWFTITDGQGLKMIGYHDGGLVTITTYIPGSEKSQPADVPYDDEAFVAAMKYLLNNQPRVPNQEEHKDLRKYMFQYIGLNLRGQHQSFDVDLKRF